MEHFSQLLIDLKQISLQDISQIPDQKQHILVEHIEKLQDELRALIEEGDL
ncbi:MULTISPECIES: hypothetical protein [Marinomonas]|uniref:hypothetical protein n=1 Tax=Marinomonas TaxID=28253 RepID=UPI001404E29E|nr:hypothetical protein [Marinomonas flavescens]